MCIHPKILLSHDFALVFWDETWQQHIMWSPGLKSGVIFPEYRHLSASKHMTSSAKCKVWRYSKDPSSHQRSQQEPAAIQHHHRHSFKITPCKQTDFHGMQMVWLLSYITTILSGYYLFYKICIILLMKPQSELLKAAEKFVVECKNASTAAN